MKPKWKYLIIAAVTLMLIAGWISLGPMILVLVVCFGADWLFRLRDRTAVLGSRSSARTVIGIERSEIQCTAMPREDTMMFMERFRQQIERFPDRPTTPEEDADLWGITEPHDERCHGNCLCREHFIEKLAEAHKRMNAGEGKLFTSGGDDGMIMVWLEKTFLFIRHRPGTPEVLANRKPVLNAQREIIGWQNTTFDSD